MEHSWLLDKRHHLASGVRIVGRVLGAAGGAVEGAGGVLGAAGEGAEGAGGVLEAAGEGVRC